MEYNTFAMQRPSGKLSGDKSVGPFGSPRWFWPNGYFFFPGISAFIRDSQVDAEAIRGAVCPCFCVGAGDVAWVSPAAPAVGGTAVAAAGPEFAGGSTAVVFD